MAPEEMMGYGTKGQPETPAGLNVTETADVLSFRLTWESVAGVTYRVCRSMDGAVQQPEAGECIADGLTEPVLTDSCVMSARDVFYSVFAYRDGQYSAPAQAAASGFAAPAPEKVWFSAAEGGLQIRWQKPEGAVRVRVLYAEGGQEPAEAPGGETHLAGENDADGLRCGGLREETNYIFRIQCAYAYHGGIRYSRGILRKGSLPEKLFDIALSAPEYRAEETVLHWTSAPVAQELLVLPVRAEAAELLLEGLTAERMRTAFGVPVLETDCSRTDSCTVPRAHGTAENYAVVIRRGQSCRLCGMFNSAGFDAVLLDPDSCTISADHVLRVRLKSLPDAVTRLFTYVITEDTPERRHPLPTERDVQNGRLMPVRREAYLQSANQLQANVKRFGYVWFCVIAELKIDGKTLFSPLTLLRQEHPAPINIIYKFSKPRLFRRNAIRLQIRSAADMLPKLYLVYMADGSAPISFSDPDLQILEVLETALFQQKQTGKHYEYTYVLSKEQADKLPPNVSLRLILDKEMQTQYQLQQE